MATIQKRERKSGARYTVTIRKQGEQITKTFRRLTDAREWAKSTEVDLGRGDTVAKGENRTVGQAIDYYLAEAERIPKGRETQLDVWRSSIGDVKVAALSRPRLFDLRAKFRKEKSRYGRPLSPATINRRFAALSAVYATIIAAGWCKVNPVSDQRGSNAKAKLKLKEPAGRDRYLSDDERRALLRACRESREPALYAFTLAAITTGCRASELQRLAWSDIRGNQATIQKSKNGLKRTVFLTDELRAEMKALPTPIAGGVFASADGSYPFQYGHPFANAVKAAGIENFRFHDCRHTAASYLAMSGATLIDLQRMLGHKSPAMTMRYAHLCDSHLAEVHSRMAESFLAS